MKKKNDIVAFWLYSEIIDNIILLLDNFDAYTKDHCLRVGVYTGMFLKYLQESNSHIVANLTDDNIKDIVYAAFVHDLGKATIFADIIKKSEGLTEEDWTNVHQHPKSGAFFFLAPGYETIRDGVLMHHERFDGKGYPFGYQGENISLCARIIAIADSFDAMTDKRPYAKRPPMNIQEASKEILLSAGTQFDPELALLFVKMCESIEYRDILEMKKNPDIFTTTVASFKDWIHDEDSDFKLELINDKDTGKYVLIKSKNPNKPRI